MENKDFIEVKTLNGVSVIVAVSSIALIEDLGVKGTRIFMKEISPDSDNKPIQVITKLSYGFIRGMIENARK